MVCLDVVFFVFILFVVYSSIMASKKKLKISKLSI